jgi:hypothetical protein
VTKRYLTYFMWGYQEHFKHSMEYRASTVFAELGINLPLQGLLIGVRAPEIKNGYEVCHVPEDGDLDPAIFALCHARTEEIFNNHPDHNIFYGDEPSMRDKPENIRRKSVTQAVDEALTHYGSGYGAASFCGIAVRVGDYYVVPAFLVSQESLSCLPHLSKPIKFQEWSSRTSIVDALLYHLLAKASEGLGKKEPGRFLSEFRDDIPGILRQAAADLCSAISLATRDFMFQEVFQSINKVSALRYEGAETKGSIVFGTPNAPEIDYQVRFKKPTPLTSHRLVRKLIEMSGNGLACVCDGSNGLSGLASITADAGEALFRVIFTGHYQWSLLYGDTILMECAFGVPVIPSLRLTEPAFLSNIQRILPGLTTDQGHTLWVAVSAAMDQKHGTMLVVSEDASGEADRLQNQSIPIQPKTLSPELIERISGIDGAILLDRNCRCHAIGVILDGMASQTGDSSRGARFNSAIRYVPSVRVPTLCLVVSEDGYVNMVPTLRPQVNRAEVELNVQRLRSLTSENYHATRNWLENHRFYLTSEQCEVVNAELARIHSEPKEVGEIQIITHPFSPHPEMNETYYLDYSNNAS